MVVGGEQAVQLVAGQGGQGLALVVVDAGEQAQHEREPAGGERRGELVEGVADRAGAGGQPLPVGDGGRAEQPQRGRQRVGDGDHGVAGRDAQGVAHPGRERDLAADPHVRLDRALLGGAQHDGAVADLDRHARVGPPAQRLAAAGQRDAVVTLLARAVDWDLLGGVRGHAHDVGEREHRAAGARGGAAAYDRAHGRAQRVQTGVAALLVGEVAGVLMPATVRAARRRTVAGPRFGRIGHEARAAGACARLRRRSRAGPSQGSGHLAGVADVGLVGRVRGSARRGRDWDPSQELELERGLEPLTCRLRGGCSAV